MIDDPDFVVRTLEFDDILDGIESVARHNLNSTAAAILQAHLRFTCPMRPAGASVRVASDKRLLRAAKAEGLEVLKPKAVQPVDGPAFLAAL